MNAELTPKKLELFEGAVPNLARARTKLPAMYGFRGWVDAGGLISYGTNLHAMFHQAGGQVAKILSGGKPADLAVEQPTTFELVVNMKTAKALGLMIPLSMLARVDQIAE